MMSETPTLLTSRAMLCEPDRLVEGGGLLLVGERIERVLDTPAQVRRCATAQGIAIQDLGDGLLAPGLVNAHVHLDLSALAGKVSPDGGFLAWIGGVMQGRASVSAAEFAAAAESACRALLASGTTCVGDVDATGVGQQALARSALRGVLYREALDAGQPARAETRLAELSAPLQLRSALREGLSPHAPHTVSEPLMRGLADLSTERGLPISVHWSESEEECQWLAQGTGPFAALLANSPGATGLELLQRNGLLGARTSLVHGNYPLPGEAQSLRDSGATLVHCPGSHLFFQREPFPLAEYMRAGCSLALGTDSAASNADLDMRREMALLRTAHPELAPEAVWRAGTAGGARALGLADHVGCLAPGFVADCCLHEVAESGLSSVLEVLTSDSPTLRGVWVGARQVAGTAS